ncbi:MAG TPA: NBR1-Ig-like domain-containing protein [Anaerolineales bacterium]|nr:NBR1-Ig-like domain-containing protein [Anaerolineales bacterium]
MTVYDSAQFSPGQEFTKVWRLQNVGSCTWNKDYEITFDGGDKMNGTTVSMPEKVFPGEVVDIAIEMQAPNSKGTYKGYWLLRTDNGSKFGIGSGANMPFWAEIKVVTSPDYQYNFAANFCDAAWKSDGHTLYCSGTAEGFSNYVQFTNKLVMEGDKHEDEAALIINVAEDDRVRGTYPAYTVQSGDHFLARIGCVDDSPNCKVKIVLRYVIKGDDTNVELGEWIESNDGDITLIDIDLDSLAGEEVIFTLDVTSRSSSDDNRMFWFVPSIQN